MEFVSDKVQQLPPYLFSKFQERKKELQDQGVDVIDLGIGAPDLPTPEFVIDRLVEESRKSENHVYAPYSGAQEFKEAVAYFYKQHYGVELDPETEVLTLIGSKEGIANTIQAVLNKGDVVLTPNPGYPVYSTAIHLAGAKNVPFPIDATRGYEPQFNDIDPNDIEQAKMMILNYPSNPTSATIDRNVFLKAITFAEENDLIIANDAAYDLVTFGDYISPSLMQVPGAKERAIEFGSLSKSFNMTGWRIGFIVGNKDIIQSLSTLKSNIDSSQFLPIQLAGATALTSDLSEVRKNNTIIEERMEKVCHALETLGIRFEKPRGTIFVWAEVPEGYTSASFADTLLEQAGIIVTPGSSFGSGGEGYFRIALTVTTERFDEVVKRLQHIQL
ncbi:MAG TPA: aminotransferase class I/II-fold pyridoxal phosphate-dependent enzyme [Bacillota bacterium]|nr:aminotransferase class I/II-fold pyridoxal phosphate-dependent enzyme [Bacillota bacterium]